MTRKEFLKVCGILGINMPFYSSCLSSSLMNNAESNFSGKVIIIGAGAGGLSAGYLLKQLGIDFEILEASSNYGGRMKINNDFTDFPIPLGAEWIESNPSVLSKIINNTSVQVDIESISDLPDYKFVNSSWFTFFERYIVPSIADHIVFDSVVSSINYSGDPIVVTTENSEQVADKVIISVPLKILQDKDIELLPELPKYKQNAINDAVIWDGFKAFFEFSDRFYNVGFEEILENSVSGQKIYYDASYGQNSQKKIIGLFAVGHSVNKYTGLTDSQLKKIVLTELDVMFSNQATVNYIKHISQDWNKEPFIRSGYLSDHTDWQMVKKLGTTINEKLYFAGGAYTDGEDWVSVHTAAKSAKRVIDEIKL